MTAENKPVKDQLLKFWSEMHKDNKKKRRKRRVAVVAETQKKVCSSYDSDTDDEAPNTSTNVFECKGSMNSTIVLGWRWYYWMDGVG